MLYILSVMAWMATGAILILFLLDRPWRDALCDEVVPDSAIERLVQAQRDRPPDGHEEVSPLVRQAQLFAAYLNPPAAPKQARPATLREKTSVASTASDVSPPDTSPKFELRGISYHRSKPSESMALVWDAADGHRWVKQGAQLGHIVIESIESKGIRYSSNQQVYTMAVADAPHPPEQGTDAKVQFASKQISAPARRKAVVSNVPLPSERLGGQSDAGTLPNPTAKRTPLRRYKLGR